jgi:predicted transcriptional regulator
VAYSSQETLAEIEYHSARVLILIAYCGSPVESPRIKGRTLLAKLDFFLRYPLYLDKAAVTLTGKNLEELTHEKLHAFEVNNIESKMIRYKYGPWDNVYYTILAYLISKDLIRVELEGNVENFLLTKSGEALVARLSKVAVFQTLIVRAQVLKRLFVNWKGATVKKFIYQHFPEVVSLPLGKEIG